MKKRLAFPIVILMLASLVACNLPSSTPTETPISIDAAFTAAAQTVEARLTDAALTQAAAGPVATNTFTPAPFTNTPPLPTASNTPLPTKIQSCDLAQFVTDVTVPDDTNFNAGDTFTKTWRIKNVGTCSWTPSYSLIFVNGTSMSGPSTVALTKNVNPGETVDLSVNLTAPSANGDYTGNWQIRNAAGTSFPSGFYVKIKVGGGGTTTGTPAAGEFAVTNVTFTTSGGCDGFTVIAQVKANGTGTVTYHWVRSDGATDTTLHEALDYTGVGTQSVTTSWDTTASGDKWIDLYIDEPNHQQFGRAEFSCP